MENKTPNHSIECSVKQCEYHCQNENYCTLNTVRIATHEANPTVCQCVDCESFVKKSDCAGGNCH
ncbi:MAG: DUF1540 domain-containing protein [Clostridia bacterium]|nr:DUF1540 domain-containing protein [Clostridia bacterium]